MKKHVAVLLILVLVINLVSFGFGKIGAAAFWIIIGLTFLLKKILDRA